MSRKITIIIDDEPIYGKAPPDWWVEQENKRRERERLRENGEATPRDWTKQLTELFPTKAV